MPSLFELGGRCKKLRAVRFIVHLIRYTTYKAKAKHRVWKEQKNEGVIKRDRISIGYGGYRIAYITWDHIKLCSDYRSGHFYMECGKCSQCVFYTCRRDLGNFNH